MAIQFLTPDDIAEEYLTHLKSLKPEINRDQADSDWAIRGQVLGGVVSGLYEDQKKAQNDAFPQEARREALSRHLDTYFDRDFEDATQAEGVVRVTGLIGTVIPALTEFVHEPTGNVYKSTEEVTLAATAGEVNVQSVDAGQDQNLLEGTELSLSTPPAGLDNTAEVTEENIANGKDEETKEEAAAKILNRVRTPPRGGNENDYKTWAQEADPSVSSVTVKRFILGFGTVGLYITAGTTDIDQAIDEGQAIVRIPSDDLVESVQEYVDEKNPITDCLSVLKPAEVTQDVTVRVKFREGVSGSTILAGQTLTCEELVEREIKRSLYKVPTGGTQIGGSGFVVASEIEENLDFQLGDTQYNQGDKAQILVSRQVDDLAASGVNRYMLANEIIIPGTITVVEL